MWPARALSRPPVAFVIGTTGAGKTKLAVQLAAQFGGEVVNGDAIQLYQGLNVASAKATVTEAAGVPHHLFSFLPPTQEFTVRDFASLAGAAIGDIHSRGKLPVVVGGTMYYAQALLSQTLLDVPGDELGGSAVPPPSQYTLPSGQTMTLGGATPDESTLAAAYAELQRVDAVTAARLHRHDWRKIARALQVFASAGKPQSKVFEEQAHNLADWTCPYSVRVLWPHTDRAVLTQRLNDRVHGMLQDGLLPEVTALHRALQGKASEQSHEAAAREAKYVGASELTKRLWASHVTDASVCRDGTVVGALQAIGYREFEQYLGECSQARAGAGAASGAGAQQPGSSEQQALLRAALDTLRLRTRQYAMKQLSWIRNRFIKRGLTVHELDSSDVQQWDDQVAQPALRQVRELLQGVHNDQQSVPSAADAPRKEHWERFTCHLCGVECVTPTERQQHLASGKHRRAEAAAKALPRQWMAMYATMRERGMDHEQAQAAVQAVPRFSQLSHEQANGELGGGQSAVGGVKRDRSQ